LEANVMTFSKNMKEQIDLRVEASNLLKFRKNFQNMESVTFPEPISKLVHPLILTETWEYGTPMSEFIHSTDENKVKIRKQLASIGVVLYLKMLVDDNFLHGDLHPGNLFVNVDKMGNPHVVILDVGLVSQLKQKDRANLVNLFTQIIKGKGYEAADCLIDRTSRPNLNKQAIEDFKQDLAKIFTDLASLNTPEVEMGKNFQKVLELGRKHQITVDSSLATALIGTIVIEGMGRQLNPQLDFISESAPVLSMDWDLRAEYLKLRLESFVQKSADTLKVEVESNADRMSKLLNLPEPY